MPDTRVFMQVGRQEILAEKSGLQRANRLPETFGPEGVPPEKISEIFFLQKIRDEKIKKKFPGLSRKRLPRYNRLPIAFDLNQRVWRDQEEPPRPVF